MCIIDTACANGTFRRHRLHSWPEGMLRGPVEYFPPVPPLSLWPYRTARGTTGKLQRQRFQIILAATSNSGSNLKSTQGEVTLLLAKWRDGEPSAFEQLTPLVYPHLRDVAATYIRRERNPGDLQATALVDELCLRLIPRPKITFHFLP